MKTIAVIGLGLIGGSILKGLKNKGYNLVGTSKNPETVKKALDQGLISGTSIDEADVIFICTPINITIDTIKEVAKFRGQVSRGLVINQHPIKIDV